MKWNVDPTHSNIEFSIRHLGLTTVRGRFRRFDGEGRTNDQGQLEWLRLRIEVASISTLNDDRDAHLLQADFFDAQRYPDMVFESDTITPVESHSFNVQGKLTLHGQTHPFEFRLDTTQPVRGMFGETRIGADMTGYLRRSTWGLTWNQMLELGGVALSDDVSLQISIQVTPESEPKLRQHWQLEDSEQPVDFTLRHHRTLRGQLRGFGGWVEILDGRPDALQLDVAECKFDGVASTTLARLLPAQTEKGGAAPLSFKTNTIRTLSPGEYEAEGTGRIGSLSMPLKVTLGSVRLPQGGGRAYVGARVQLNLSGGSLSRLLPDAEPNTELKTSLWFTMPAVMTSVQTDKN